MRSRVICLLLLPILGLLFPRASLAQSDEVNRIYITGIDADQFPEVKIRLRILNSTGQSIANLSPDNLQVTENGAEVSGSKTLLRTDDGELWIHFVINAGSGMRGGLTENAVQSIQAFLTLPEFSNGNDYIALSRINQQDLITFSPFTPRSNTFTSDALNSFTHEPDLAFTRPLASFEALLESDEWAAAGNHQKVIVYITDELDDNRLSNNQFPQAADLQRMATAAKNRNFVIYTIVVEGDISGNHLATLAENSGGRAITYSESNIESLYQEIVDRARTIYELTYRSTGSSDGIRNIQISGANGSIVDEESYTVDAAAAPQVIIDSPQDGETIAQADETTTRQVRAHVEFSNYPGRQLASAVLNINGQEVASSDNPDPSELVFEYTLDQISTEGQGTLSVEVEDELGLISSETVTFVLGPAEEPTPEVTEEPENVGPGGRTSLLIGNLILLVILIAVGIGIIFLFLNRDKAPVQQARNTIMRGVDRLTKRYVRQSEVKAYLIVLEGDSSVGKHLEVFGTTTIGRSRADSEMIFQRYDENSAISRRHCTILDEEDHFEIRDEDSANGTYLNGVRLPPMEPRELFDGDEIELARVERGGVRLQFQGLQQGQEDSFEDEEFSTRFIKRKDIEFDQDGDRF